MRPGRFPFAIAARGSTVAREGLAGLTTFATMAFILVVNPIIMAGAGMPRADLTIATALTAAATSLLVAFLSDQPLVAAPVMGSNVVFASVLVGEMGLPWQAGLAMVFLTGALFLALSLSRFRQRAIDALPPALRIGIQGSVGVVILLVALRSAHVVVTTPHWRIGAILTPAAGLALAGMGLLALLLRARIPGSLLVSILLLALAGLFVPGGHGAMLTRRPAEVLAWPRWPAGTAFQPDFGFVARHLLLCLPLMLYFFCSEFFSTLGSLVGATGMLRGGEGRSRVFVADALGTMIGALLGTAVVTVYVESAAGIQAGGRTGLTAVVAAGLFLLALFVGPLLDAIPAEATAPAMVFVSLLMFRSLHRLDRTPDAIAPAAAAMLVTLVTANLVDGIAAGVFGYLAVELLRGRAGRVALPMWAMLLMFVPYYLMQIKLI
jgi:AGZA family xanthine/uracil permease-like MFS transporter